MNPVQGKLYGRGSPPVKKKSDCRNPLRQPDRLFVQIVQLASSAAHITGDSSAGADTSSDSVK